MLPYPKHNIAILFALSIISFFSCTPEEDIKLSLDKTSIEMNVGDTQEIKVSAYTTNRKSKAKWSSSNYSVAMISPIPGGVEVRGVSPGKALVTFQLGDVFVSCSITVIANHHSYVIMGVVNGKEVRWATCNVGAGRPEEYGDYFSWGEAFPKSNYTWSTYKFGVTSVALTKYVTDNPFGTFDNKTTLDAEDDAATVNWGSPWRMPTDAEWVWLISNCTWTWTTNYNGSGVAGYIVASNSSVHDSGQIFLPVGGCYRSSGLINVRSDGYYWSSSLYPGFSGSAYSMHFPFSNGHIERNNADRSSGQSVRPVSD